MRLREEFTVAQERWQGLSIYRKFEHLVILILTGLIAIVIVAAVWSLAARSASADPQASEEAVAAYRTRAGELLLQAWEEGFLEFSLQQYNRVAHEPAFAELRDDPRLATLFEPRAL